MAFTSTPGFPIAFINIAQQILPADSTNKVTIFTAGSNGAVIESLGVTSTDTIAKYISFYINTGGSDILIGSVNITARAGDITGVSPTTPFNAATSLTTYLAHDSNGNSILTLQPGAVLKAAMAVAVSATKEVGIFGSGVSY